ncbi:MAG: glycosyltransferase family 2 protein [Eubacteriales bacterium]|nr:glycosyltransferase family 2 protein [Eubacteriales bacterium]
MLKFSIITICFNSEAVIRKTVESVLAQNYPEIEYIIVDGASSDGTVSAVREYSSAFTEKGYTLKIISEPDNGIYDAMNKGIRNSSGDIIGIINSGDWYEPEAIKTAAEAYMEDPYDLFYADINLVKANGSIIVKHSKYDRFPTSRHWNHPTTFVTKKTYEELGLFRCEGIHDDFEFLLRSRRAEKKIVIKNRTLANFAVGGTSNDKSLKKCVRRCKDRYRSYRVNGYSRLSIVECVGIELAKLIVS